MEVYLNSIEMGDGIYGAEAVAKAHFHTTASQLTRKQCALIAASLPNPRKYNSGNPALTCTSVSGNHVSNEMCSYIPGKAEK